MTTSPTGVPGCPKGTQAAGSPEPIVSHTVTEGQLGEVARAAAVHDTPMHADAASEPATTNILDLMLHLSRPLASPARCSADTRHSSRANGRIRRCAAAHR